MLKNFLNGDDEEGDNSSETLSSQPLQSLSGTNMSAIDYVYLINFASALDLSRKR